MNSMVNKKAAKREKMMNMPSYRLMVGTAKYMDKWFLDPILGFIIGSGKWITSHGINGPSPKSNFSLVTGL